MFCTAILSSLQQPVPSAHLWTHMSRRSHHLIWQTNVMLNVFCEWDEPLTSAVVQRTLRWNCLWRWSWESSLFPILLFIFPYLARGSLIRLLNFFCGLLYENVIEGISKQNLTWLRQRHVVKVVTGSGPGLGSYSACPVDRAGTWKQTFNRPRQNKEKYFNTPDRDDKQKINGQGL